MGKFVSKVCFCYVITYNLTAMRIADKKSLGLVLSGGGVKAAAFHIGVCMALREKGFKFAGGTPEDVAKNYPDDEMTFKTYVGSSAGSVISNFLASGRSLDEIINAFTLGSGLNPLSRTKPKNDYDLRPLGYRDLFSLNLDAANPSRLLKNLIKKKPFVSGGLEAFFKQGFKVNGLFNTKNLEKYLRDNATTGDTFESLGVSLFIVATQLNHSRKVIFGNYPETVRDDKVKHANFAKISEACAASAALPPFFAPYGITNQKGKEIFFFDGEIRDTLSTHVASDNDCDLIIASYSIQPYHFNSEVGSLHEYGMPIIFNQALYQVVQQKIESHLENRRKIRAMINAVDGYLKQTDIEEEHREKLLEILIDKTKAKPNIEFIYIHPSPQDYEMFFADHFSLNPKILSKILRTGFKAAMHTLRKFNL